MKTESLMNLKTVEISKACLRFETKQFLPREMKVTEYTIFHGEKVSVLPTGGFFFAFFTGSLPSALF